MERNEIYQIFGTDYVQMTRSLLEYAGLNQMILQKAGPEARILIKPNLVSPTPASFGATTHPEVVAGIIEYLQKYGFRNIRICEGSWIGDKTPEAFLYCGFQDLANTYGVSLFDTQKDTFFTKDCAGMELKLCSCIRETDFLINVPVLKGHCQTKVTCALKNMKGLIPNKEKRRFHTLGLHRPIAHLNTGIRQDFIVVDHICGDPDFEDGGNPLVKNCIMAALDPVLTDALACRILNYAPEDVAYIKLAENLNVGSADLHRLHLVTLNSSPALDSFSADAFDGADNSETNHSVSKDLDTAGRTAAPVCQARTSHASESASTAALAHRVLEVSYAVDEVESCSACYSALIGALDRLNREGKLKELTEEMKVRFCIGQGFRESLQKSADKTVPVRKCRCREESDINRVGIGSCTKNAVPEGHNIPGCPPDEETICHFLHRMLP